MSDLAAYSSANAFVAGTVLLAMLILFYFTQAVRKPETLLYRKHPSTFAAFWYFFACYFLFFVTYVISRAYYLILRDPTDAWDFDILSTILLTAGDLCMLSAALAYAL